MTEDNFYKINIMNKKLINEVDRYRKLYKYNYVMEQDVPPPPAPAGDVPPPPGGEALPPAGDVPPPPADAATLPPADVAATPPPTMEDVEEVDITDLVNMTKSIKKELDTTKQNNSGVEAKMDDVFTKLSDLEQKLASMDNLLAKIDELGSKVETMKPKSPEEKLQMRSLDSYPFNQNPQQFFATKQDEMRQTGKNEYVLTKDDVENYSKDAIKDTFNSEIEDQDEYKF